MAVVWQHTEGGRRYEVRRAGNSLRLYTNGAFHSQHNPGRIFTGAVWDLLTVPILFNAQLPASVLMLGVGGGASIHQINATVSPRRVVGIELDPVHIRIARDLFDVGENVELVEADALRWTRRDKTKFDVVIDDLFLDAADDPERPVVVDATWLESLDRRTSDHGLLIQNHLSSRLVRTLIKTHAKWLKSRFAAALLFETPHYENGILALYRSTTGTRDRARAIRRIAAVDGRAPGQLRFRCTQLF